MSTTDNAESSMPTVAAIAKRNTLIDAVISLELVARDLEALMAGEWVPDEDSTQASLDNVLSALNVLRDMLKDSGG